MKTTWLLLEMCQLWKLYQNQHFLKKSNLFKIASFTFEIFFLRFFFSLKNKWTLQYLL